MYFLFRSVVIPNITKSSTSEEKLMWTKDILQSFEIDYYWQCYLYRYHYPQMRLCSSNLSHSFLVVCVCDIANTYTCIRFVKGQSVVQPCLQKKGSFKLCFICHYVIIIELIRWMNALITVTVLSLPSIASLFMNYILVDSVSFPSYLLGNALNQRDT